MQEESTLDASKTTDRILFSFYRELYAVARTSARISFVRARATELHGYDDTPSPGFEPGNPCGNKLSRLAQYRAVPRRQYEF